MLITPCTMTFNGRTPESLIPRSDSRNPATTCKGITKSGRPCRRPIDAKASQDEGVIVVASIVDDSDDEETGLAAYFCWQHKDQAEQLAAKTTDTETHLYPLKERNSIDTLVERLGVLQVEEPKEGVQKKRRSSRSERGQSGSRPPRRIRRPPTWDNVEGPLISVPSDVMAERRRRNQRPQKYSSSKNKSGFWSSLCCGSPDEDDVETIRHRQRMSQRPVKSQLSQPEQPMQQISPLPAQARTSQAQNRKTSGSSTRAGGPSIHPPSNPPSKVPSNPSSRKPLGEKSARPINPRPRQVSETTRLLSFIPPTHSPQLTSTLLSELSKPISPHDEAGYIYIFWLTPDAAGPGPSSAAASTLLSPEPGSGSGSGSSSRPDQTRGTSEMLRQYSVKHKSGSRSRQGQTQTQPPPHSPPPTTILLKIGRANNVHRRMTEWTRQCGYHLSLVRYYPYIPSSTSSPRSSPSSHPRTVSDASVRKVPHAHRVERLIHLELGAQRVVRKCEACGKEHREWFEVEASREGVGRVDEVVRRWVGWAEERRDGNGEV